MKREFKVEVNIGAPQEQIGNNSRIKGDEYIHKKQSGGAGQFAKARLSVEPQRLAKEEKQKI